MNHETLISGLEFARKHGLTQKEINVLIPFLKRAWTTQDLAMELSVHSTTLHHIIQRLKLKNLIVLKDKDANGRILYETNVAQFE